MHSQRAAAVAATSTNGNGHPATSSSPEHINVDASPAHVPHAQSTASIRVPDGYTHNNTSAAAARRPSSSSPQAVFRGQAVRAMSTMHDERGLSIDSQMDVNGHHPYHYPTANNQQTGNTMPHNVQNDGRFGYADYHPRPMSSMQPDAVLTINSNGSLTSPPSQPTYAQQQMSYASPAVSSQQSPPTFPNMQPVTGGYNMQPVYGVTNEQSMAPPNSLNGFHADAVPNPNMEAGNFDPLAFNYTMPVFGGDGFSRSPSVIMDDNFLNLFFTMNGSFDSIQPSPPAAVEVPHDAKSFVGVVPKQEEINEVIAEADIDDDGRPDGASTTLDALDINLRESVISDKKQQRLLTLVKSWSPIEHNDGRKRKDEILVGDADLPTHVMSLHMLKTYIASYWTNIHCQMPILHRPTFNPETCPDLLVMAMACLGATCLERTHSAQQTLECAELAFFVAHHIRWEVFKDAEFRPTAKLWTFQTMLLLELFEKMYSTRALHERAHIHHATTLTVMRRGSSLIGRSATEVPHKSSDPTRTPPGPDGSINTSGQNTPDAFWNRWITAEATRRVAFAAFIIDSTHATLFSHSAAMSPHDLRLPLPCDEALWSATSSAEVQRVEASLAANGFKPTTFLDGLKKTLNGQKVRTNTFGRVILMSGLLNISWHMNQRDLQVSSLGAASTLGSQIRWRSPLTRAFDFWRRDFDESLSKSDHWLQVCNHKPNDREGAGHRDHVFESRTCLHSLAHMAMHVDITDCLVFAGSDHVLGRAVTDADRIVVQRRMRDQWAPSARARDATFYALRFLSEVLIPEEELSAKRNSDQQTPIFRYSARDDYLLNRPWVLYFALLIVWSYGYALDGALAQSTHSFSTRKSQVLDMQHYLIRMGGVASPDDLEKLNERNACLGLLLLLRESFSHPRWELLQDANAVLGSCVDLLLSTPRHDPTRKHLTGV